MTASDGRPSTPVPAYARQFEQAGWGWAAAAALARTVEDVPERLVRRCAIGPTPARIGAMRRAAPVVYGGRGGAASIEGTCRRSRRLTSRPLRLHLRGAS
jgi:hypothetical protein